MRDSLGNVIPAMTNPSPGAIKALQTPALPRNAAAIGAVTTPRQPRSLGNPLATPLRGLGSALRAV